jgi:uncharacterized protein involved in exopolysaccharide biosynthesis
LLDPAGSARGEPGGVRSIRGGPDDGTVAREISLFDAFALLLRERYLILVVTLLWVLGTVLVVLIKPREYTSSVSFVAQQSDANLGGLSSVAAQFGLRVPTSQSARSPEFYADLLRSEETFRQVAQQPFQVTRDGRKQPVALATLLRVEKLPAPQRLEATMRALGRVVSVSTKRESGIVRVSVHTRWPEVSYQIAGMLLEVLNRFNLETSQSQASSERQFAGARLDEASSDLRVAEDELQQFLSRNRQFSTAPDLMFEHERLQRRVTMRQELMTALSEAHARARIEEVRNAPPLTVIAPARLPAFPDARGLASKGLVALIVGLLFGITLAVLREVALTRWRAADSGVREFVRVRDEVLKDLGWGKRFGKGHGVG